MIRSGGRIALAFLILSVVGAPGATSETPDEHRILVPPGYMLEGRVVAGRFMASAVPLEVPRSSMSPGAATVVSECALTTTFSAYLLPNPGYPLDPPTCSFAPFVHHGPVHVVQLRTVGDYVGILTLKDVAGTYRISCAPAGSILGVGAHDEWVTFFQGHGFECFVTSTGVPPSQFSEWFGYVENNHSAGNTYASAFSRSNP